MKVPPAAEPNIAWRLGLFVTQGSPLNASNACRRAGTLAQGAGADKAAGLRLQDSVTPRPAAEPHEAEQVKSLDWRRRNATVIEALPRKTVSDVLY